METILLIVHVLLSITVIGLVLVQHGKGAEAGAAFGSGASATVFGSRGSGSFLTRLTTIIVTLFFVSSIGLFILASQRTSENTGSIIDSVTTENPATPANSSQDSSTSGNPATSESEENVSDVPKIK